MKSRRTEARRLRILARNEAIRREYVQRHEVERIRPDDIVRDLATRYGLTEKTIEEIIYLRGHYRDYHKN